LSLLIVGTVAFDQIETPFGKTDKIVGGSAPYIGLAASQFVDEINLVSIIGSDFPTHYLQLLQDRGFRTEGLQVVDGEKSFFWSGKYHHDMNMRDTLVTDLNVLEGFDPIIPESYQRSEYVMLGNLTPEVQIKVTERIHKRPKLVVMDTMNFWMEPPFRSGLDHVITKVDVVTLNDSEARQYTGEYSLVRAAHMILDKGPEYVVIKKGENGALLFHRDNVFFAPALPLEEVFDPTGAGDTFAGGFIGYLAKTGNLSFDNMKRAIIYGSAMASFCVEKFGTERLTEVTHDEVEERIGDFIDLVQFDIELVED
jgi:sugar/nucleoside kinase (ribokinase family)